MTTAKRICAAACLTTAVAAFGLDFHTPPMSAGVGGLLGAAISRYAITSDAEASLTQNIDQLGCGVYAFLDADYGEITVTARTGTARYSQSLKEKGAPDFPLGDNRGVDNAIGVGILLKYPLRVRRWLAAFPLLGVEYQMALRHQTDAPEMTVTGKALDLPLSAWNAWWIDLGVGADVSLRGRFYVRGEFIYGFRLMTGYERDGLKQAKELLRDDDPTLSGVTSGPVFRGGVGYRL